MRSWRFWSPGTKLVQFIPYIILCIIISLIIHPSSSIINNNSHMPCHASSHHHFILSSFHFFLQPRAPPHPIIHASTFGEFFLIFIVIVFLFVCVIYSRGELDRSLGHFRPISGDGAEQQSSPRTGNRT
ncbi:hypothetical protein V8E52_010938 [Russula decolorans]